MCLMNWTVFGKYCECKRNSVVEKWMEWGYSISWAIIVNRTETFDWTIVSRISELKSLPQKPESENICKSISLRMFLYQPMEMATLSSIECFVWRLFVKWNEFQITDAFNDDWTFFSTDIFKVFTQCVNAYVFFYDSFFLCDCENQIHRNSIREHMNTVPIFFFLAMHVNWLEENQAVIFQADDFIFCWLHKGKIWRKFQHDHVYSTLIIIFTKSIRI